MAEVLSFFMTGESVYSHVLLREILEAITGRMVYLAIFKVYSELPSSYKYWWVRPLHFPLMSTIIIIHV